MFLRACVLAVFASGVVLACGGDDEEGGKSTGGTGGATGGAGGATGGAGGTTGGSGGATDGGGGAAGSGGFDAASCSAFGQVPDCTTCLSGNCCKEAFDCAAEKVCTDFVTCARACPDQTDTGSACMQACIAANNPSGGNYNGLLICMQTKCNTVCGYL